MGDANNISLGLGKGGKGEGNGPSYVRRSQATVPCRPPASNVVPSSPMNSTFVAGAMEAHGNEWRSELDARDQSVMDLACATANMDPSWDHAASTGANERYSRLVRHLQESPTKAQTLIRLSDEVVRRRGEEGEGENVMDVTALSCGRSIRVASMKLTKPTRLEGTAIRENKTAHPVPSGRCLQNLSWRSGAKDPFSHTSSVAIQYDPCFPPCELAVAGAENETRSTRVGSIGFPTLETRFEGEISISRSWASSAGE